MPFVLCPWRRAACACSLPACLPTPCPCFFLTGIPLPACAPSSPSHWRDLEEDYRPMPLSYCRPYFVLPFSSLLSSCLPGWRRRLPACTCLVCLVTYCLPSPTCAHVVACRFFGLVLPSPSLAALPCPTPLPCPHHPYTPAPCCTLPLPAPPTPLLETEHLPCTPFAMIC